MDTYTIKKAYHWTNGDELEIKSKNLTYAEFGTTHAGCQCVNQVNIDAILDRCNQVAVLIREIDELNKN